MTVHTTPQTATPRRVLAITAWVLLAIVVLSFIAAIPDVQAWLERMDRQPAFEAVHRLVPITAGLAAGLAWVAALWHAIVDREPHLLPKPFLLVLLVFGNVISALLYYFLFVHWTPDPRLSRSSIREADG